MNLDNWKHKHSTDLARYLEVLDKGASAAKDLVMGVKVTPKTSPRKQLSLMTLNSLLERAESVSVLAHQNRASGVEIIARSAFENYVDLKNLHRYPKEYPQFMMYLSENQKLRGLRIIKSNPEKEFARKIIVGLPAQVGLTVDQAFDMSRTDRDKLRTRLTRNYFKGGRHHSDPKAQVEESVLFRAKLAGEEDVYRSAYKILSSYVHGDVSSMLGSTVRNMKVSWPPHSAPVSIMSISLVTGALLDGSTLVAKKLRKPVSPFNQLRALRDTLPN